MDRFAARYLRNHPTDAEKLLWYHLRQKALKGQKFRRQFPIGPLIVDFVCLPKRLVIEVDGGQHAEPAESDKQRTNFLKGKGFSVLRFSNNDVLENTEAVVEAIAEHL